MIDTVKVWRIHRDQAGILTTRIYIYIIHRIASDLEEEAQRIYKE